MRAEMAVYENEEGRSATEVTETPVHPQQGDSPTSDAKEESNGVVVSVASELRAQLSLLAEKRAAQARLDEVLRAARSEFAAVFSSLIEGHKAVSAEVIALDATVRALALIEHGATKEKAVAPGVNIRMRGTLLYDPAVAFTWAKEKDMATIPASLDVAAFEKIARATTLPFVVYAEVPEVTIATKLAEALAAEVAS